LQAQQYIFREAAFQIPHQSFTFSTLIVPDENVALEKCGEPLKRDLGMDSETLDTKI